MNAVTLVRVVVADEGAFGVLIFEGLPFAVTLEHTYGPERRIKIPPGAWPCDRTYYHRGKYSTFEIHVPGHSRLLFHRGNVEPDTDGCILVAARFGRLGGRAAILQSVEGFNEFMIRLGDTAVFALNVTHEGVMPMR